MPIELNNREFMWIRRALKNARECLEDQNYRGALLELKKPMKRMESQPISTRLQALCQITQADAWHAMQKPKEELKCLKAADAIFAKLQDESEEAVQIRKRIAEIIAKEKAAGSR
ncbi:hypothetical protein [Ileibacterium valens]|uniref:hypothetical protein n=1 Tax=Ileibacterium valens TaxID=1862668 RepID=UPI0027298213|nr:hypothetical protein [Ileibacterium valens]